MARSGQRAAVARGASKVRCGGEEFEALIAMAEKRASGQCDDLTEDVIEHFIATVRSHMLEEDEEERFDETEDELYEAVGRQLKGHSRAGTVLIPDRRWTKRQEGIDLALEAWRADLARGRISDFVKESCSAGRKATGYVWTRKAMVFVGWRSASCSSWSSSETLPRSARRQARSNAEAPGALDPRETPRAAGSEDHRPG
jgi:hypothetical protein